MLRSLFRKRPRERDLGAITAGQGLIAMDSLFFKYVAGVLSEAGSSHEVIRMTLAGYAGELTNIDPSQHLAARHTIYERVAAPWPTGMSDSFFVALGAP